MHVVIKNVSVLKKQVSGSKETDEEQGSNFNPPYKSPGCTRIKRLPTLEELDNRKQ